MQIQVRLSLEQSRYKSIDHAKTLLIMLILRVNGLKLNQPLAKIQTALTSRLVRAVKTYEAFQMTSNSSNRYTSISIAQTNSAAQHNHSSHFPKTQSHQDLPIE